MSLKVTCYIFYCKTLQSSLNIFFVIVALLVDIIVLVIMIARGWGSTKPNFICQIKISTMPQWTKERTLCIDLFGYLYNHRRMFPVWLRNWLIFTGLELVLSHTEKSCIASYYREVFTNLGNFHFNICGKLSIIWCDE